MANDDATAMDEARKAAEGGPMERLLERLMDRTGGHVGVQTAFGEAIQRGELTVVPVARARWLFGAGGGSGPNPDDEAEGLSSGSGGGGGGTVTPVGFVEIGPSGAIFRPIADPYPSAAFVLAVGLTMAIVLRALARLVRG